MATTESEPEAVPTPPPKRAKRGVPEGLWKRCPGCQNTIFRKEAEKRYEKRKKSYDKIVKAMQEAKAELVPFMSDLNDIRKLLDSELTDATVAATKNTIKSADWHGEDVRESLSDVEKELDRVAADLAKYK